MPRENAAARAERARRIQRRLARAYPDARCALHYQTPFQLLVATILSAQCTDEKVNEVTAELFRDYGKPAPLAEADPAVIEEIVHATGFYRQKTKSIMATARDVAERFGGEVPKTLPELVSLRGVARKTANVVLGNCFGVPGLAVDTHMKRVNQRLALTRHDDPERIERDLMQLVPEADWTRYTHRVIHHGRVCCHAKGPRCESCPLREDCPWPTAARSRARRSARPRKGVSAGSGEAPRFRLSMSREHVTLPGGREVDLDIVRHPGASAIVPFLDADHVMLIRQYRHAAGGTILEVPAGKLDPGDTPESCALRELEEEAGLRAGRLDALGWIFTTPGFTDEVIHLFAAHDLEKVPTRHQADEVIELCPTPFAEALGLVFRGALTDAKSALALIHAAHRLGRLA